VSLQRPRIVTISTSDGHVLRRFTVRPGVRQRVTVPLRFDRRSLLVVKATPGPEQIPGPDPRDVSIRVARLAFRASGGQR
jgi:hypothetical protein